MFYVSLATLLFHLNLEIILVFILIQIAWQSSWRSSEWLFSVSWIPQYKFMGLPVACKPWCFQQCGSSVFDITWSHPSFHSRINSLWMSSLKDIPMIDLSIALCVVTSLCSSFFVVAYVLLVDNIAGKAVRLAFRVWSKFVLITSFIEIFLLDLIPRKIYASMSRYIFTIHLLFCFFDFITFQHFLSFSLSLSLFMSLSLSLSLSLSCSVSWGCRIHRPLLSRGVTPPNECPGYDTKQSDGEVPVMQGFWDMRSTPSLPLLPGPLWPGVVVSDRALSMV